MSNETLFFILGIALAVSAVVVSLLGLRLKDFPGKAMPVVVLWFALLVGGATTFAVLHAKDEDKEKAAKFAEANVEIEKETSSGPFEGGEEGGGNAELGAQVYEEAGCGSCHIFKAAGSTGTIGPDLDEFLAPDDDKAAIEEMIVKPNAEVVEGYSANVMPANFGALLKPNEITALVDFLYLNSPAGEGKGGSKGAAAKGPGGTLQLAASPTELKFDKAELTSKPGKVTIDFENPAPLEHNVAIEQGGKQIAVSELIAEGKTTVSAELAPGTYTFLCTVPGHAEAGMEGELTVR